MAASTVARNQQDVDQMSKKDRLYDRLNYTYGLQKDQSNEAFNKAINQQDRNLLQRGMNRSSFGLQTIADLYNQKIKAENNLGSAMIAEYEKGLFDLEQQEKEDERFNMQFKEGQRQYDTTMAFQQSEAARDQGNKLWQQKFQEGEAARDQGNIDWTHAFQKGQADWERAYSQQQLDLQKEQFAVQKEQWDKDYNYRQMSDDRKYAFDSVAQIIANGNDPSDDLLRQAGLSRADANAMKAQAKSGGGGGGAAAWKKYGFPSKEAYDAYLKQYGQPPVAGDSDGSLFGDMGDNPTGGYTYYKYHYPEENLNDKGSKTTRY